MEEDLPKEHIGHHFRINCSCVVVCRKRGYDRVDSNSHQVKTECNLFGKAQHVNTEGVPPATHIKTESIPRQGHTNLSITRKAI